MSSRNTQYPISIILLLLILLLALGLRFYRLDAQSLWNDEGTSVALAQRDLATIARDAAQDIHPPLYYWLLHGWMRLTGSSEFAVRALSAFWGAILVALIYALGRLLAGRWAGLAAAALAAMNPFQVYYSQEARMYMLLAVFSALLFYAALRWAAATPGERLPWSSVYVLAGAAGIYTHYAFPMMLLAVNLVVLLDIGLRGRQGATINRRPERAKPAEAGSRQGDSSSFALSARRFIAGPIAHWLTLQVAVALLFLPWLPTALRQLSTWPRVAEPFNLGGAISETFRLMWWGPATPPEWASGWASAMLFLVFLIFPWRQKRSSDRTRRLPNAIAYLTPVLWLILPVLLIFGLGLFKEAYLKFLLVISPAFCLLLGRLTNISPYGSRRDQRWTKAFPVVMLLLLTIIPSLGLFRYYTDPAYARDDYRAIAAYVEAVGQPGDAVLLNAPGQQEVFGYYYARDLPVYPLPESRPLDPAATEAALIEMAQPGARVFAVLWATDESDPQRFIEGWLDVHAYKALDSWYGNVRLAVYAVPEQTPDAPEHLLNIRLRSPTNGDEITLLGYSQLNDRLVAGDIAQITLFWQAGRTPTRRYKVFLHVLDAGNHIVGQRDAEPGGGANLTTLWQPGEVVADNYGLPIHPATPPGDYRVEVGLYDAETGQRLLSPQGEGQVWLRPLAVERPLAPAPVAALGMQHAADAGFGELTLWGYDAHKLGFAHRPSAPLRPGDLLHVNLYWRAETQPGGDWQVRLSLMDSDGQEVTELTAGLVGGYPTSMWQAGDVWRGQFNLAIPADAPPGRYRLRIQPIASDGSTPQSFQSKPLTVVR